MFSICFFCWPRVPKCWFIRLLGSMILKYHRVSSTVCVLQFWNLCTVFKKQVYAIYINSTNSAKRSGHIAARIVPETCWWLAKVCDRYAPWSGPFNQILMGVYVFFFPVGILLSLCVLEKNLKKNKHLICSFKSCFWKSLKHACIMYSHSTLELLTTASRLIGSQFILLPNSNPEQNILSHPYLPTSLKVST